MVSTKQAESQLVETVASNAWYFIHTWKKRKGFGRILADCMERMAGEWSERPAGRNLTDASGNRCIHSRLPKIRSSLQRIL
ncbi:hypothetical protein COCNU_07G007880 [Cocos nucifera]|uniref:Uncharacterized protein n=1 Tax=Cocos nucifera TaxID=13894 RepID=A0A8K0IEN7_COCNU|nr:hypothetical protein COCNU_07G007880 [Cocos nucifera]